MSVVIRRAVADDAAVLAGLAAATFPLACPPHTTDEAKASFIAEHLSHASFVAYLSDPRRDILVAEVAANFAPAATATTATTASDTTATTATTASDTTASDATATASDTTASDATATASDTTASDATATASDTTASDATATASDTTASDATATANSGISDISDTAGMSDAADISGTPASEAAEVVGYTMLVSVEPSDADVASALTVWPTIELSKFYVLANRHGQGVASAMMTATLDAARARGASGVWLGVNEENARANRFYEKNGFTPVGTKRFLVGENYEDDFVRQLAL